MSSITSPIFSGVSSYAKDLQQVINRSVGIAALPLQPLRNHLEDLNLRSSALAGLDAAFSKLQTAIHDVDLSLGSKSYTGISSDPNLVGVSVDAGAVESTYTINVTSVGSYTTAMSDPALPPVSDPATSSISTSEEYTLTIDGHDVTIQPDGNNLMALVQAINRSSAGVRASLVNLGNSSSPQYSLILNSTSLGDVSMQLVSVQPDGTTQDLLSDPTPGSQATYDLNGLGLSIQSDSRTVTVAPGVTIDLLQETPGAAVSVTVSRDTSSAATALAAFAEAYNDTIAALDRQVGEQAGALSGQSIIRELYSSLRSLSQFTAGSGSVTSFADLGLSLDQNGNLTFDESQFNEDSVEGIQNFLGGASTGGFLKLATDILNGVEDTSTGSLTQAAKLIDQQVATQNDLIAKNVQRVTDLQTRLQQQMAAADALIASLESRKNYITGLFTAMQSASESS